MIELGDVLFLLVLLVGAVGTVSIFASVVLIAVAVRNIFVELVA